VRSVYLTVSDHDLVREIDKMRFDIGETEIWLKTWHLARAFAMAKDPLGPWIRAQTKTGKQLFLKLPRDIGLLGGGDDETRTRDLRRDRAPVAYRIIKQS
jgi:hypothetical protein